MRLKLVLGGGIGSRTAKIPSTEGLQRLSLTLFAAADLGMEVSLEPTPHGPLALIAGISYRTSLGLTTRYTRGDGSTQDANVREQRVEVLGGADIRIGGPAALELRAGWAARVYDSPAVTSVPDITLAGLLLRAMGRVTFGRVTLALGPELFWLLSTDDAYHQLELDSHPFGWGLEGRISVRVSNAVSIEGVLRESRVTLASSDLEGDDVARFATVRVAYRP